MLFDDHNYSTVGAGQVKFGMEVNHKYLYISYVKYHFFTSNDKRGDNVKL
jgi:hypothetical protein